MLVRFKGLIANIRIYKWNSNVQEIEECYDNNEFFYNIQNPSTSSYDFIIGFDSTKAESKEIDPSKLEKGTKISLSKNEINYKNVNKVIYTAIDKKK